MYPQPKEIKSITSIGGGPIGGGWSAHFLAKGYNVKSYLHDHKEESEFWNILKTAWRSLRELGLSPGASLNNLSIVYSIEEAVKETEFIQESAPEILSLKQELYKFLGEVVPRNIVIGSSTSGLTMTDIQLHCSTAARTVIAHPFNPPYLLPLVEIVGGEKTSKDTVDWANSFFKAAGKEPLLMRKEIPGFVATRLQEALWREALHMVANDEASPDDIDKALMNGPALRMAVQGQCMAFHVACGRGGMATNLDQFGPALKLPWTRLNAPELTPNLRNKMVEGCDDIAGARDFTELATQRDREIVAMINALKKVKND